MTGISAASSLTESSTANTGSSTSQTRSMDMNAFLRMFTTQLRYQDPTNPLESYELAAQLAQFSTVEKLTDISAKLEAQQQYLVSLTNTQMVQMIGKEVTGNFDGMRLSDGAASKGYYELAGPAAGVTIQIYSENGALVRTMNVGAKASGMHNVDWNGKDDSGSTLPDGSYRFAVQPLAADGSSLPVRQFVKGTAFAFRMVDGVGYLVLDGDNGLLMPASTLTDVHRAAGS